MGESVVALGDGSGGGTDTYVKQRRGLAGLNLAPMRHRTALRAGSKRARSTQVSQADAPSFEDVRGRVPRVLVVWPPKIK